MFGVRDALVAWEFDPAPTIGVAVAGLGYWSARKGLAKTGRTWARQRDVTFCAGLLVLLIAVDGPPGALDGVSFAAHMVQHLLIQLVAAPLLLLAAPVTLLLRADPRWLPRRVVARVLRARIVHLMSRPVVTFLAFSVVLVASHLSAAYDLSLRNETVHGLEHSAYLVSALAFWWPAMGVDPGPTKPSHPARMLYLLLVMPVMALLGVAIANTDRILYPYYGAHPPPWGAAPLQDQHFAGTLMWISGMIVIPPILVLVLLQWLDQDEREQTRRVAGTGYGAQAGGR